MFRKENELLESLFGSMMNRNNKTSKYDEIEKYRDEDGFINLTNVKDFDELCKIMNLVDKKNYLEMFDNNKKDVNEMAESLAKVLHDKFNVKNVKVNITTPEGNACVDLSEDEINKSDDLNEITSNKESIIETPVDNTTNETTLKDDTVFDEICGENEIHDVVVLYDVGGMYNPQFFNSVLHICEKEHFRKSGVYSEFEKSMHNANVHVLLPNVWVKMFEGAVETFTEKLMKGDKVYVIHPETFDLIEIINESDFDEFIMTKVQEQYL